MGAREGSFEAGISKDGQTPSTLCWHTPWV